MRVGSVGFFTAHKNNNIQNKTSFKADVRIAGGFNYSGNEMPEEQARPLFQSLVHAMNAYKDKGSDNILLYLKPVFTPGSWTKKPKTDIQILALFKNPDVAIKEVKAKAQNNPEEFFARNMSASYKQELKERMLLLENPTENVRKQYRDTILIDEACGNNALNTANLDKTVNSVIDNMTHRLPFKEPATISPFVWEKKNAYEKPQVYTPGEEDNIYERLSANYPQWEKDLWDEIGVDYKKEIREDGSVFSA